MIPSCSNEVYWLWLYWTPHVVIFNVDLIQILFQLMNSQTEENTEEVAIEAIKEKAFGDCMTIEEKQKLDSISNPKIVSLVNYKKLHSDCQKQIIIYIQVAVQSRLFRGID